MSRTTELPCFQIVLDEGLSGICSHTIPNKDLAPKKVYMQYNTAMEVLKLYAQKLSSFIPVAYGQAFPYDTVSFEQLLYEKGYATYGWFLVNSNDEEEEQMRVGIGLQLLQAVLPQEG